MVQQSDTDRKRKIDRGDEEREERGTEEGYRQTGNEEKARKRVSQREESWKIRRELERDRQRGETEEMHTDR